MTAILRLLPTELLEMICAYLEKEDISSLHLASRDLSTKTRPAFYLACFETVDLVLCKKYIERLAEIECHPQARKAVRNFRVCGNPKGLGRQALAEIQGEWHRAPSGYLEPPFPVDIDILLGPILSDGFPNCHNFKVVYMPCDHNHRNLNWVTEGDALGFLLRFVALSNRPFSSFHIVMSRFCSDAPLSLSRVPLSVLQDPKFTRRWQENIRELNIVLPRTVPSGSFNGPECPVSMLVAKAASLTNFSLKFFHTGLFRQILVTAPSWRPPLEHLTLYDQNHDDESPDTRALCSFLLSFKTSLRSIAINTLFLPEKDAWKAVLQTLAQSFALLYWIDFEDWFVKNEEGVVTKLAFTGLASRDSKVGLTLCHDARQEVTGIKYRGPDKDTVLHSLLREGFPSPAEEVW
ncbi:uncharacterized protein K452DRAFT_307321 [Aplosporella prunicola CBS 121167]|uniref:F-box domain-containing protein n=1 Tax=Aplosporella prunicola CBS 121167 TaxID=1176127 RepID=A0A6A6BIP8_9PEZI|nr:uncharacterized protein K452DRAFT_307321 [Aplosporella prunicola CBS 121167]KAF2143144.1 hypothetical protein K452DRAFT_307321 [Aplosporella prunicola CBS 121167]